MSCQIITTATQREAASIARSATSGVIFTSEQDGLTLVGVPDADGAAVGAAFRRARKPIVSTPAAPSAGSRIVQTHATCRDCVATPVGVVHMVAGVVI